MAGPIQTALGQALASIGGAALVGKGVADETAKRQAEEKQEQEAAEAEARKQAMAKSLSQAVSYKIIEPMYFWKGEEPLATSNEMATLAADTSLMNFKSARDRTRKGIKARMANLKARADTSYKQEPKKEDYTYGR